MLSKSSVLVFFLTHNNLNKEYVYLLKQNYILDFVQNYYNHYLEYNL
jgi:hypothetical protein